MEETIQNLHSCAHCNGSGTCKNGNEGESCAACVKSNELKKGNYYGIACGTCGGLGKTDSYTYRLNHRAAPMLAVIIVTICFILILVFAAFKSPHFSAILAFCGTMVGTVTGHYFGNSNDFKK